MDQFIWDLESEYKSYESSEFQADFQYVKDQVERLQKWSEDFLKDVHNTDLIQKILVQTQEALTIASNLSVYLGCCSSVDTQDTVAEAFESELEVLTSKISQSLVPLENHLLRCADEVLETVLSHPELQAARFSWTYRRQLKDILLSDEQQTLLSGLSQSGHHAWGSLYSKICGSMVCELKWKEKTEKVGLAQASAMIRSADEETRKVAWNSIQTAWKTHQDSAAAILNAIAGWRHEENKFRSHSRKVHFLDAPTHNNRIQKETLEAMMGACEKSLPQTRRAARGMARLLGKSALDPWDLLAQSPVSATGGRAKSASEAMDLIVQSFGEVDPQFAEFAKMMWQKKWIEGRILPNKSNGGYCTRFAKSREPRVFMTYMGSNNDVSTLAHEIGHAFHGWVMRDMSPYETRYSMSLAETASIFAETVLQDALMAKAQSKEEKIEFAWGDAEKAAGFLINIPARFDFEKSFYEKRLERALSVDEFKKLTDTAWTKWYGPTLSKNDDMYWATKLHFHMSGTSFYNFPYTFGYLFSLGIYARREQMGPQFFQKYIDILRDTGRMTAEDLVQKHLGEDIRRPEFWQKSIDVVIAKIQKFEELAFKS